MAIDPEKLWQYAEIRRNELYWRGNQYLDEVYNNDGQLVDYKPINGTWHEFNGDDDGAGQYSTVINDFRGYGRKFIAVEAQQPPNVKAEPNDPENEDHRRRAKLAQRVADLLHSGLWDVKAQNRKLFLTYFKNGTAFGHTVFVSDGEKYGWIEEPVMETQPTPTGPAMATCPSCGTQTPVQGTPPPACPNCQMPLGPENVTEPEMAMMPQPTGETKRYANGCVEHHVESGLRVTTQFNIEELTDTPYLLKEGELHKGKIFQLFPWLRDKFKNEGDASYSSGGTATTSGQITRDIASSPSGTFIAPRKNHLLFSEFWLRPTMYELALGDVSIPDANGGEPQSMELRRAYSKLYPKGMKVTMVGGDQVAKIEEARMDDEWNMSPPEPAENAFPDALGKDYLDTQDLTNDLANIQKQTYERQIPQLGFDTGRVDMTFQAKYRQLPASLIPMKGTAGGKLDDAFTRIPVATPEPEMEKYAVQQREHSAEIIGITKAIFGGGAPNQTAYGTNLNRNQAMLQLSTQGDAGRTYWCKTTFNAVMLTAKHSNGTIPSPHAPSTETVTIEGIKELLHGGFHFEGADAMPMSWPEQREQMNETLKNNAGNPMMLERMGWFLPANIREVQDKLIGMPNWKVQNEDALAKVDRCIVQLLKASPLQKPSQQVPGQTIDIPSIPVDDWDDHSFVAMAMVDWLNSEKGEEQRNSNPGGFANCVAFWKSHAGLALPPPMPPGGAPGPGGEPTGGGKPAPGGPGHLQPPPGGQQAQAVPVQ